jgi:hypothetical protein
MRGDARPHTRLNLDGDTYPHAAVNTVAKPYATGRNRREFADAWPHDAHLVGAGVPQP